MRKQTLILLLLSFILTACGKSNSTSEEAAADTVSLTDADVTGETVPDAALTFKTNADLISMSVTQEEKMIKALEVLKLVVGTEEFRDQVLGHTYNGAKTFVDNNGMSNEQIYKAILEAAEKLQPAKNNSLDME